MSTSEATIPILAAPNNCQYRSYSVQNNIQNEQVSCLCKTCGCLRAKFQFYEIIFLVILLLIFFAGVLIGVYLLATEGHEWRDSRVYKLTSRELWKAQVASSAIPKLKLPVQTVLFLPTNSSSSCDGKSHCAKLVQELQTKHMNQWKQPDIMYNFIVASDGTIFEGRGWNFQTNLSNELSANTISIAFFGNFRVNYSMTRQTESITFFFNNAVLDGNLESCIKTEIWSDRRFFIEMVKNVRETVSTCKNSS